MKQPKTYIFRLNIILSKLISTTFLSNVCATQNCDCEELSYCDII